MGAQGQQQQGQVYYDADTGQYYTQSSQRQDNPMAALFGLNRNSQRNYLNNFNNQSMTAKEIAPYNYVDIAALFPQLSQAATVVPASSLLGDTTQDTTTGEAKGAATAASSGAGRFM